MTITATYLGVSGTARLTVSSATLTSIGITPNPGRCCCRRERATNRNRGVQRLDEGRSHQCRHMDIFGHFRHFRFQRSRFAWPTHRSRQWHRQHHGLFRSRLRQRCGDGFAVDRGSVLRHRRQYRRDLRATGGTGKKVEVKGFHDTSPLTRRVQNSLNPFKKDDG